jgi:WD40 repeat protein
VTMSRDGKVAASGSSDKTIRIWDTETGVQLRVIAKVHSKAVLSVGLTPDVRMVLSGGEDGKVLLCDISSGKIVYRLGEREAIHGVAVSSDGTRGAAGGVDKTVHVWNLANSKEVCSCFGHEATVNSVAFSPDGRYVLSASDDRTIRLWEVDTGLPIHVFAGHTQAVTSVVFSPEGKRFLSASADGTIRFWDVPTKKQLHQFEGHQGTVTGVAVSPGGRFAVSSGSDKTVRLWGLPAPAPELLGK